jgi:hypothetical protein
VIRHAAGWNNNDLPYHNGIACIELVIYQAAKLLGVFIIVSAIVVNLIFVPLS